MLRPFPHSQRTGPEQRTSRDHPSPKGGRRPHYIPNTKDTDKTWRQKLDYEVNKETPISFSCYSSFLFLSWMSLPRETSDVSNVCKEGRDGHKKGSQCCKGIKGGSIGNIYIKRYRPWRRENHVKKSYGTNGLVIKMILLLFLNKQLFLIVYLDNIT